MDKAILAEWILRRVVGPERAAEMVGDLLETQAAADRFRFGLSVMWLAFVFSWQMLAALVMSVLVGFLCAWQPFFWTIVRLAHSGHRMPPAMFFTSSYLFGMSMLFWSEAGFCFVHFGIRHPLSRISVVAAMFGSVVTCCWWLPHAPIMLAVLALGIVVAYTTSRTRRLFLAIWSAALVLDWLTVFTLSHLPSRALAFIGGWKIIAMFLVPIAEASVSVSLYRRFFESSPRRVIV